MAGRILVLAVVHAALLAGPAAAQFGADREARNYSKTAERAREHGTPEYRAELARRSIENHRKALAIRAGDPERDFTANLCWGGGDGCAGDVRLYDWEAGRHGIVRPVLYTARNGATISGHVWATRSGPARRPGIVITNGSVQAPEQLFDTFGEGVDRNEGFPAQAGRPFYDGTEDALDFFLSTPERPYRPRPSCTTGTDHSPKQERRVREGRNAAHNPLWELLDPERIGLAGHSFGASGVSFVGQADPRVDAIVAWDNLRTPGSAMSVPGCPSAPETRVAPAITKPALGMAADYFLVPTPFTSAPDPDEKSAASLEYSRAGVDTGQLNIRGGTHYEFSYIPNPAFGATLRGMDLVAWYTAAWFDKYVAGDPGADRRLITNRWRADAPGAAVDPEGDGNLFSFYFRSRLDMESFRCEDLRSGDCDLRPDDRPAPYSYLDEALTPDGAAPAG